MPPNGLLRDMHIEYGQIILVFPDNFVGYKSAYETRLEQYFVLFEVASVLRAVKGHIVLTCLVLHVDLQDHLVFLVALTHLSEGLRRVKIFGGAPVPVELDSLLVLPALDCFR